METYTINENLKIEAWYFETRHNWGHNARAIYRGQEVAEVKIVYQNRTWESYKFQSVMEKLIDVLDASNAIPLADRIQASKTIKAGDGRDMKGLRSLGALATMAGIMGGNDMKAKVIASIPGVIVPDDFDNLPEDEKTKRLDGVIDIITK